jgi:hypothetical protein
MYGSYGYYSGNKSNLSVSANLYKPAGVVNTTSSYQALNGVVTSNPTIQHTSIASSMGNNNPNSLQSYTNTIASAQHVDYQQNSSQINLPVRQTGIDQNGNVAIYEDGGKTIIDINGNQVTIPLSQGSYTQQYSLPGLNYLTPVGTNPETIVNQQYLTPNNNS